MKKITIIGGGAWGATLGQVLTDNNHEVLIYDINEKYIEYINNQKHPIFDRPLLKLKATNNLKKAINFSDIFILCIPTQKIRKLLKKINNFLNKPKNFINVSKGIEIKSNKTIFQITQEEIEKEKIKNYACLLGPSHAEEVILRKITFLTIASNNEKFSNQIIEIFSNKKYLKIYTSKDIKGCEICGAFKNALALISGLLENENFDQNAKAAFITLGIQEMKNILLSLNCNPETAINLTGLGDLIVTSFNKNSRNYKAGRQIILGQKLNEIFSNSKQVIEGIHNIQAFYQISIKNNIKLPIIQNSYKIIFDKKPIHNIINYIFEFN
jgi:glycerol-3-phosphate dehydrogenase (NAD(P)+)